MAAKSILVIHGPNLNLLGAREPEHYGHATLGSINTSLSAIAKTAGVALESYQSNAEADIVAKIHTLATEKVDFIIINPAAFTHTSVSIRDAILVHSTFSGSHSGRSVFFTFIRLLS